MKIRNGFVSNSSSSSFVLVGVKVDEDMIDDELFEKLSGKFNVLTSGDDDVPDGTYVIGELISDSQDSMLLPAELSLESVQKKLSNIEKALKNENIKGTSGIFMGVRST